jgi:uncharacterized YccA/Bax inhibitor family protein
MRSSNPVFSRRGFSRDNGYAGFNTAPQAGGAAVGTQGNPYAQPQAGNPYAQNPYAQQDLQYGAPPQAPATTGRMTMDDVILRTATTLGTLIVTAALAWFLLPVDAENINRSYGIAIGAGLVGMVLALVQSFKRKASPALILSYAALEGVFLGVVSSVVDEHIASGAAMQAVLGTMAELGPATEREHIRVGRLTAALGYTKIVVVGEAAAPIAVGAGGIAQRVDDPDEAARLVAAEAPADAIVLVKGSRVVGLERTASLLIEGAGVGATGEGSA